MDPRGKTWRIAEAAPLFFWKSVIQVQNWFEGRRSPKKVGSLLDRCSIDSSKHRVMMSPFFGEIWADPPLSRSSQDLATRPNLAENPLLPSCFSISTLPCNIGNHALSIFSVMTDLNASTTSGSNCFPALSTISSIAFQGGIPLR